VSILLHAIWRIRTVCVVLILTEHRDAIYMQMIKSGISCYHIPGYQLSPQLNPTKGGWPAKGLYPTGYELRIRIQFLPHRKHCISFYKNVSVNGVREIIIIWCKKHTKLWIHCVGKAQESFNDELGGTYSYRCTDNRQFSLQDPNSRPLTPTWALYVTWIATCWPDSGFDGRIILK
jgi:hypothetical protein